MLNGTIVKVDKSINKATLTYNKRLYIFQLSKDLENIKVGDSASFNIEKKASLFKEGVCSINNIFPFDFEKVSDDDFLLTDKKTFDDDIDVIQEDFSLYQCSDSHDLKTLYSQIIEKAKNCNANCLLDIHMAPVFHKYLKCCHLTLCARLAIVNCKNNKKIPYKAGINLKINDKLVRRQSPNADNNRYIRVLLSSSAFIILPSLMRLEQTGVITPIIFYTIMYIYGFLALFGIVTVNSHKDATYQIKTHSK